MQEKRSHHLLERGARPRCRQKRRLRGWQDWAGDRMRKCLTGFLVQGSLLRSFDEELMNKTCVSRKSTSSIILFLTWPFSFFSFYILISNICSLSAILEIPMWIFEVRFSDEAFLFRNAPSRWWIMDQARIHIFTHIWFVVLHVNSTSIKLQSFLPLVRNHLFLKVYSWLPIWTLFQITFFLNVSRRGNREQTVAFIC